ncbi:MAG: diaminobutyrate acetyltransferase [Dehalococcoidia bacterium]
MNARSSETASKQRQPTGVSLREPTLADGGGMWRLARESGLDVNSEYSYLMMCQYFAGSSIVAEDNRDIVGFITGFRPPETPDAIFVWQIAVAESMRGQGLARRMLEGLLTRDANKDVRYIHATIGPSNTASQRTFRSLARHMGVECKESPLFLTSHFTGEAHEDEVLFQIGPFRD